MSKPSKFEMMAEIYKSFSTDNKWPRGVVVSALTSHMRDAGFDSRPG